MVDYLHGQMLMPDKRTHRGPNPADVKLFAPLAIKALRQAVADFSFLLTKGYTEKSALKLVGDRFLLTSRQRVAVMRCACADEQLQLRKRRCVKKAAGEKIAIDGYNVLITIEAAMSGAVVLKGRDGCFKDIASIHGTYRKVDETIPAVHLIGQFLTENGINDCLWLLDSPVSNSGRLKTLIGQLAKENGWDWKVELAANPDAILIKTDRIAASSDGVILDGCSRWINLAAAIIESKLPDVWLIDLS